MFTNNTNQSNVFGGNTQQQGSIFGGQQQPQQGNNIFGQQQGNNMLNNQQQQGNNMFGNQQQQQQQNNMFSNNQANQQQRGIFGGNQQQQGNTLFTNPQQQQQQQQQGNNIFSNQQFGNQQQQQQGNNIFTNQQQPTNPFGNQQPQTTSPFGTHQLPPQTQTPLLASNWNNRLSPTEDVRQRIQECCKRVDPRNLEYIKLDEMNMYKNTRLNDLPTEFKNSLGVIMNNMKELRQFVDSIKRENDILNKELASYCDNVREKLVNYKEVLIQNIQQSNMLEEVRAEVDLINTQVQQVIIPIYNNQKQNFDSPDEFSATIARKILEKMIQLNNKVDQIISCQNDSQSVSEQDANTLMVLEQLLNYYENVSAKVFEFKEKYNVIKRLQIEKSRRHDSYEEVMQRINSKVKTKMEKDFMSYDLLKQIEDILDRREKKEKQTKENPKEILTTNWQRQNFSEGWGRYGGIY